MTVRSTPGAGQLLHGAPVPARAAGRRAQPRAAGAARSGYAGARRRVLVVDNEEADRRLLADRLRAAGLRGAQAGLGRGGAGAAARAAASTRSSWTWPCPASTAGRPCAACAPAPERRAGRHRLGQRLRQGAGQRRRHRRGRLPRQAGARQRAAGLAGRRLALEWVAAGRRRQPAPPPAPAARRCRRPAPSREQLLAAAASWCAWATCAASCASSTTIEAARPDCAPCSRSCARWRAASTSTHDALDPDAIAQTHAA